jgi:hypothetical protein
MKKLIALGLAAAGVFWVVAKSQQDKPADTWAAASDKV